VKLIWSQYELYEQFAIACSARLYCPVRDIGSYSDRGPEKPTTKEYQEGILIVNE
jgi:hypothetical protein